MILTMAEDQIRKLLANPLDLDLQCERFVQLLKTKQAEGTQNVVSGSDHNNQGNLASSTNKLNTTAGIPSVQTFVGPNPTLTGLPTTTSNFVGVDPNLMQTYAHTMGVLPTFHAPLWPGNMSPGNISPGVGIINNANNANYSFVVNPNISPDTNYSTLPNSNH